VDVLNQGVRRDDLARAIERLPDGSVIPDADDQPGRADVIASGRAAPIDLCLKAPEETELPEVANAQCSLRN